GPGERVGLIGANGSGKTTLVRLLGGLPHQEEGQSEGAPDAVGRTLRPGRSSPSPSREGGPTALTPPRASDEGLVAAGKVVRGKSVRLGYLGQDDEGLDPSLSARQVVAQVRGNVLASEGAGSVGGVLERLGLGGAVQWTPAGELSGGERRRVQLLGLLVDEPNVLLLDEPTNDLDVDTLNELEDLLDGWAGSLLVVSHDRYF